MQGTENLGMGIRREIEACRVVKGLEPKQQGPLGCKVGISNEVEASRAVEGPEPEKGGRATGWSTLGECLSIRRFKELLTSPKGFCLAQF